MSILQALAAGSIPYAVTGGNAVADWVGRIDRAAVRFTQDIDILLRREDLPQSLAALEQAGLVFRHAEVLIQCHRQETLVAGSPSRLLFTHMLRRAAD